MSVSLQRRKVLSALCVTLGATLGASVAPGLLGCGAGRASRNTVRASPAQLQKIVDEARQGSRFFALQGRFSVHLEGPGMSGSTKGALVLHQPDRFRIEIQSPFGTPMMLVASDGHAIHAWASKDNRFFRGDDASAVLQELTRGAVGLGDVNAMLTGGLPLPDAPISDLSEDSEGMVRLTLDAPEDVRVRAVLDPHSHLTHELRVVRGGGPDVPGIPGVSMGETLLQLDYLETMRVGNTRLPEIVSLSLPSLGWKLELEFLSWDELGQIPEVFTLAPPPGSSEEDLVATLRSLAERQAQADVSSP